MVNWFAWVVHADIISRPSINVFCIDFQAYSSEYTVKVGNHKWFQHIITIIAVDTNIVFWLIRHPLLFCSIHFIRDTRVPQMDTHCPNTEQIEYAIFYS